MWISKTRAASASLYPGLLLVGVLVSSALVLAELPGLYSIQEVKPKVYVWIPDDVIDQNCDPLFTRPATSGFIITSQGVVVVDTANSPMHARDVLFEIRRRSEIPVRYVVNTSGAGDHILGNEVFLDEEATVISTQPAQAEMREYRSDLSARMHNENGWKLQARMRGFHVTPSTETFNGTMTLTLGGQEIRLISMLGSGGAAGDAVVYLPAAKVLFLGELYDNQYFPRIGSRNIEEWIEVLRQLETWNVDVYVPAHGAPGTKKDLTDFRKFLEWLVAQVEMRLKQGQRPDDVKRSLWLPSRYRWHAADLAQETVADVCRQLAPQHATPHSSPAIVQPGSQ